MVSWFDGTGPRKGDTRFLALEANPGGWGAFSTGDGPGRFCGGCGVYRKYEIEAPMSLFAWFERSVTLAWGLLGGKDAIGPDVVVNPDRSDERHKLKTNGLPMKVRDVVKFYTGGGGGYGNPWERDPRLVREDVIDS